MLIVLSFSWLLDLAVFSVYCTLSYSVIIAHRLIFIGYLVAPAHFFRCWEKELLLRIFDAEIVFSRMGVATVNALLISRVVLRFFLLVEQLVFWRSIKAYKKSFALNFLLFYLDFDFVFFFEFNCRVGGLAGFFLSPLLIIT